MSPNLQAALNNVQNETPGVTGNLANISSGKLRDDKLIVLTYLFCYSIAGQYSAFAPPTVAGAQPLLAAMQGVTEDNMMDLMIGAWCWRSGFQHTSWDVILATAKAALDGQGGLTAFNFQQLTNYCLLYWLAGIIVL